MQEKGFLKEQMMEKAQIEQACKENDHKLIGKLLDSMESSELKNKAFQEVIGYFTAQHYFPVGYAIAFIKWLLEEGNLADAMKQIARCRKMGVQEERLSRHVYEYLIKPNEAYYKERFNRNLELLQNSRIFLTDIAFDFDQLKKNLSVIASNLHELPEALVKRKSKTFLLVDVIDTELIARLLEQKNILYLIYDDLRKFYYMLFFVDLSIFSKYMERNIEENINRSAIVLFAYKDTEFLEKFFINPMVSLPELCINMSENKAYSKIIGAISIRVHEKLMFAKETIAAYYKKLNRKYYKKLFSNSPVDIKILLCVSEFTELNKFLVGNWHKAFLELGYRSELLIEREPYELMDGRFLMKRLYEYKPDIVFMMNWHVDTLFEKDEDIRGNLLWINRYRDPKHLSYADKDYDNYCNMFFLPIFFEWTDLLKKEGVPKNRIFNTPEGVDISIFSKSDLITAPYACDIVCVNNAGGNEAARLNWWLSHTEHKEFRLFYNDLYETMKEQALDNIHIHSPDNIRSLINKKLAELGFVITHGVKEDMLNIYINILDSICRTMIMEWVIDSGITRSIKLWGKGWVNNEKFKGFHMGTAAHGEELAGIYRSSSISISDSLWGLHERNFEILSSGGFPLIRYVKLPEVEEKNMVTNYFKEDEEIVLFYSKEDLLNKLQYYLDNPGERERIAENGRQVVLGNFSHVAVAKKAMAFIKNYYIT